MRALKRGVPSADVVSRPVCLPSILPFPFVLTGLLAHLAHYSLFHDILISSARPRFVSLHVKTTRRVQIHFKEELLLAL